jgi:hypothetical protein
MTAAEEKRPKAHMLKLQMSEDPEDREVGHYNGPLPTTFLVVGDFLEGPDARAIEDRKPVRVDRDNLAKVRGEHKNSGRLWDSLQLLVENAPAEVHVEYMNGSKEDLACDFEDAPTLSKSGFYKSANPYNHQGMRPYTAILMLDTVDGYLLRQLATVGWYKNMPIFVNGAGAIDTAKPETRFVVPCPSGVMLAARMVMSSIVNGDTIPEITTCAGTPLCSLLLLTHFAHQVLHIDYRRQCPSRDRDARAMTDILNAGISARLRNEPGVSARVSGFEWKTRPYAETTLSVTTPGLSVEDRIALQFEYA